MTAIVAQPGITPATPLLPTAESGRVYAGHRLADGTTCVWVHYVNGGGVQQMRRLALVQPRHSSEFNWGYGGSGPAELARQILRDLLGRPLLHQPGVYQRFKAAFVAGWGDTWRLSETEIRRWLEAQRDELGLPLAGTCTSCGCTDDATCPGGCSWANPEHTRCSACDDGLFAGWGDLWQ